MSQTMKYLSLLCACLRAETGLALEEAGQLDTVPLVGTVVLNQDTGSHTLSFSIQY